MLFFKIKEKRQSSEDIGSFEVQTKNGRFVRLENFLNFKEINEAKELQIQQNESNNS